jgi:outer membrane protein assembly factor BamB
MNRREFLATSALTFTAGCGVLEDGGSSSTGVSTVHWPGTLQSGGQRQFAPAARPGSNFTKNWTLSRGFEGHFGGNHLLSADGYVFSSVREPMDSSIVAVAPETGKIEWTSDFYVTDLGYVDGRLVGLTENGTLILDPETGDRVGLVSEVSDPNYGRASGTVSSSGYYVGVLGQEVVGVVDVADGSLAWKAELGGYDRSIVDAVVQDKTVYLWALNDDQHELLIHDLATGGEQATHAFPDVELAVPRYLLADGDTVVAGVPSYPLASESQSGFVAVTTDGTVQWTTSAVRPNDEEATSRLHPEPALDDTHLYVRQENTVQALDRTTGEQVWEFTGANTLSNGLVSTGDTVFTADKRGDAEIRVHAIDADSGDATAISFEKEGSGLSSGLTEVLPSERGLFVGSEYLYHLE